MRIVMIGALGAMLLSGCQAETFSPVTLARIEVVSGDGATAAPFSRPDSAVVFRLLDDRGEPMVGLPVHVVSLSQDLSFDHSTDTSGVDGLVLVRPRAGRIPGSQTFRVLSDLGAFADAHLTVRGMTAIALATSGDLSCAVDTTATAWCWGYDQRGGLGDSGQAGVGAPYFSTYHPVRVRGGQHWSAIAVGDQFACGITTTGPTWCWGDGTLGQLGRGAFAGDGSCPIGPYACSSVPTAIAGDPGFVSLTATERAICGLTATGEAWCWGTLWDQVVDQHWLTPHQMGGSLRFRELTGGYDFACGISTADEVWCWGGNALGQLAHLPSFAGSDTAVLVAAVPAGSHLSGHDDMMCTLTPQRQATCWGYLKTTGSFAYAPTRVPALDGSRAIGALWYSLYRLDATSSLSAWDYWGKRLTQAPAPFDRLIEIQAGANNACGRAIDGLVVCWGDNYAGALGAPDQFGWSDGYIWPPVFVVAPTDTVAP